MGFPSQTWPGLLDDLNRLAFPYRWVTRAICLDKTDATKVLGRIRRQWFSKRKSIAAILKEVMTKRGLGLDGLGRRQQGARRRSGAAGNSAPIWSARPYVHRDRHRLGRRSAHCRRADCAWLRRPFRAATSPSCARPSMRSRPGWGAFRAHVYANVPPAADLDAQPRAHDAVLGGLGGSPDRRASERAASVLWAAPKARRRFRLSLHVGDVGHTLVVGPTGSGKSVLLALMALQFRRYAGSQVFAFDFGGSIRAAALAMGGDWHDLGGIARRTASPSPSRCNRSRGSTTPLSAPGPPNGWRRSLVGNGSR